MHQETSLGAEDSNQNASPHHLLSKTIEGRVLQRPLQGLQAMWRHET
jgi:hypothetical protein